MEKEETMKSWKTTLGGVMLAIGTPLANVTSPNWVHLLGLALTTAGGLILGASARDNNVSSEDAGLK